MFDIVFDFFIEFINSMGWYLAMIILLTWLGYLVFGGKK